MALALALSPMSGHAATAWAPTTTHAALLKAESTSVTGMSRAAVPTTTYRINAYGRPAVQALVTPLDSTKLLHVAVSLNLRNVDQLQAFNKSLNTPGSANYRQFLTPAQFKASYAPTDAQVQAVVTHMQQSGFTNITVSPNNTLVFADGNPAAVGTAFNATMKSYTENGKLRFGNDSDAMVPQALSGIVGAVTGLQNVSVRHPLSHVGAQISSVAATGTQTGPTNVLHPPTQFPLIYDAASTPSAYNTTVGIITWGDLTQTQADLRTMTTVNGMNPVNVKVVPVTLAGERDFSDDPNGDGEWNLDSQTIVGTSGGVKQLVFYTVANGRYGAYDEELTDAGITAAYNKAVTDNIAKIINVSLGGDETATHESGSQTADDAIFAQAVAQGQTFSVASGDQGVYTATGGEFETNAGVVLPAPFSLSTYSASEPAVSPNVIAVGGTELTTNGTAWAGEVTWNDGIADAGDGDNRIWATGGGVSLFEAAPAWQATALGATARQVPDIAFDASSVTGALIYIGGQKYGVGGTSLASPIFVGVFARAQTYANNSIGFPASDMYRDFPNHPAVLHDVTSGNNGVWLAGTTYGYNAAAGWDFTTGYGSLDINAFNLLAYTWGNGTPPSGVAPPPVLTALTNNVAVTTQGTAGAAQQFTLVVPAGARTLTFNTYGGTGDVTMYVKCGSAASASSYDYVSAHANTNSETVTIRPVTAGTYYVTLTGGSAIFSGVSVIGSWQ
ncbi:sedolisin-B [Rhodanobacter panaciterrae]|uniref:Sedolisin-B n=1 Tax=Rhodanobacter panaciterrae TaxID=490572 RepID=A0ABQ2ZXH6_9GAMM|nr:protease pro-enzyme activation domain-containing protein [Rhodanobacter panaciterrae]GGY26619.1 sedolisin-B [Rhodanobacter panaciterrae]